GTVGVIMLTIGGILGGILISRDGLKKWMLPMVLSINIPNAFYALLAITKTTNIVAVVSTVVLEQFGYGFGIAGFMVYLIYIAEGASKTSHYALATGFMALGMMLPGFISGYVQEWLGYDGFFIWVVIGALPALFMLKYLDYPADYGKKGANLEN
ncbi:MAG: MFS transporter, partial [Eudoraea sp.]